MTSMQDALADLCEMALSAPQDAEAAVWTAAESYSLNPTLLRRKFLEQFRCEPGAYADQVARQASFRGALAKAEIQQRIEDDARSVAERRAIFAFFVGRLVR